MSSRTPKDGSTRDVALRHGTNKSRLGCKTCKLRRVKCDETKPFCQRCARAKINCQGYSDNHRPQRWHPTIIHPSTSITRCIDHLADPIDYERVAPRTFHVIVAPAMSKGFATDLWVRSLPLVAMRCAPIRQAVSSFSLLYELIFLRRINLSAGESATAFAHHGRGVEELKTMMMEKPSRQVVEVALLSCLLFAAIESVLGRGTSAQQHMSAGMRIMIEHDVPEGSTLPETYVSSIFLKHAFVRNDCQMAELASINDAAPEQRLILSRTARRVPPMLFSLE